MTQKDFAMIQAAVRATVTTDGLLVPRQLLTGIRQVEIRREKNLISITPLQFDDPILQLGQAPIIEEHQDVSEHHDLYIYP